MASHSSILAWEIPWLQSMGWRRVRHHWACPHTQHWQRDHSKTKTVQRMGFRWQLADLLPRFFQKGQLIKTQLLKGPNCLSLKGKLTDPLLKQLSYLLVDAGRAGRGKDWLVGANAEVSIETREEGGRKSEANPSLRKVRSLNQKICTIEVCTSMKSPRD